MVNGTATGPFGHLPRFTGRHTVSDQPVDASGTRYGRKSQSRIACGIKGKERVIVASGETTVALLVFAGVVGLIGAGLLAAACCVLRRTRGPQ